MQQGEIEAMQRLEKMELIAKKCEHFISLLEEKLATTPESAASLEKKVNEIDASCAEFIRESNESIREFKESVEGRLQALEQAKSEPTLTVTGTEEPVAITGTGAENTETATE